MPFDRLGDVTKLERKGAVSAVGNPNGISWAMPVEPDKIAQIGQKEIVFQSTFISRGHSGGGLLNENAAIVGMVVADQPPFARARKIDAIFDLVKQWGYPVTLQEKLVRDRTLLHVAAGKGDVVAIKGLLALCGDVNARDDSNSTPLHWAAVSDSTEAIQLLWKAGADLNVMGAAGSTPLHLAVWTKKIESVKFLINAGATVSVKDTGGDTPLHWLALRGSAEIAKLLVAAGADVKAINRDRRNPLHLAVASAPFINGSPFGEKDRPQWLAIISLLVDAGAKVEATILFDAVRMGEVETVRILVKSVSNLNAGISNQYNGTLPELPGQTLLHAAARRGETEIVKILLSAGANANAPGYRGETPLNLAVSDDKPAVQNLLIAAGARIASSGLEESDLDRWLIRAVTNRQLEVVKLLMTAGVNPNLEGYSWAQPVLHEAIDRGDLEIVRVLVKAGANLNAISNNETPLQRARRKGLAAIVQVLLDAGAVSSPQ